MTGRVVGTLRDHAPDEERCFLELDGGSANALPVDHRLYPPATVLATAAEVELLDVTPGGTYGWFFGRRLGEGGRWLAMNTPSGPAVFKPDDEQEMLAILRALDAPTVTMAKRLPVQQNADPHVLMVILTFILVFSANAVLDAMGVDLSTAAEIIGGVVLLAGFIQLWSRIVGPAWSRRVRIKSLTSS